MDAFGQETRPPLMFEKLPVEHRLVCAAAPILATTFCDRLQFVSLADRYTIFYSKAADDYSAKLYNRGVGPY